MTPTPAPRITTSGTLDFASAHRQITGGPWKMRQAWLEKEHPQLLVASVYFAWEPEAFWVLAHLPDNHITTDSTADSQDLWTLGDVFEVFIERDGIPFYLELHTAPAGHRLHLAFPQNWRDQIAQGKATLDNYRQSPVAFPAWVNKPHGANFWEVLTNVPATILAPYDPFIAGQILNASFCRYDAGNTKKPILSSTSPHLIPNYHHRHDWQKIQLDEAP